MTIFRFLNNFQELKMEPESELTRPVAAPGKIRLLGGSGSATLAATQQAASRLFHYNRVCLNSLHHNRLAALLQAAVQSVMVYLVVQSVCSLS